MRTEEIHTKRASDWRPERSALVLAAVGKLGEELSETAARCFRIVIQGLDAPDPDDKRPNREHLADEIADVEAMVQLLKAHIALDVWPMADRTQAKVDLKAPWLAAIKAEEDGAGDFVAMVARLQTSEEFTPSDGVEDAVGALDTLILMARNMVSAPPCSWRNPNGSCDHCETPGGCDGPTR